MKIKTNKMKKTILIVTLLLSGLISKTATAQIHLDFNIGLQPIWGPVGYDHAEYYYMPDIDMYYNIPNHQYIYMDNGRWRFSTSVPGRYRDYDFNRGYKVVVNEPRPYNHADMYRTKYAGYKGDHSQEIIRNSHENKYYENKDHPNHNQWNHGDNGNEKDHGHGNDKKGNDHDHR